MSVPLSTPTVPAYGHSEYTSPFDSATAPADRPARKRRRLDLVKCDRCRKDKVKCLHNDREWPQKCIRCEDKELPCSEGTRAERQTNSRKQPDQTSFGEPVTEPSQPVSDDRIENWVFLVGFTKLMGMAMRRLHDFETVINRTFGVEAWHWRGALDKQSEVKRLENFCKELTAYVRSTGRELLISAHNASQHRLQSVLLDLSTLEDFFEGKYEICPICEATDEEEESLVKLRLRNATLEEFFERYSRLEWHFRQCFEDYKEPEDNESLFELQSIIHTRAKQILGETESEKMGTSLYDLFPTSPERLLGLLHTWTRLTGPSISSLYNEERSNLGDCLGWTWLHHILYHEPMSWKGLSTEYELDLDQMITTSEVINAQDILGLAPLHVACLRSNLEAVKGLLRLGADPGRKTVHGMQALHFASATGNEKICESLLSTSNIDADALDAFNHTALYYAVAKEREVVVKLLLSTNGVDSNQYSPDREPILHVAVRSGNEAIVQELLDHGADASAKDWRPRNAFAVAVSEKHTNIMKLLGAKENVLVDLKGTFDRTPLVEAANDGFLEGVKYLGGRDDVNLNSRDRFGYTPLHLACKSGHSDVVEFLLEFRAVEVNALDRMNETPLMMASMKGHSAMVRLLLNCPEIQVNRQDSDGCTALICAARCGHAEVVDLLLKHPGINIWLRGRAVFSREHRAAIDYAREDKYPNIVEMLEKAELEPSNLVV